MAKKTAQTYKEVMRRETIDPMDKTKVRRLAIGAGCLIAFWLYGASYIVYGEGLGLGTCWKTGWSLSHTFVEYAYFMLPDGCKLVPDADAWGRDRIILILLACTLAVLLIRAAWKRAYGDQ